MWTVAALGLRFARRSWVSRLFGNAVVSETLSGTPLAALAITRSEATIGTLLLILTRPALRLGKVLLTLRPAGMVKGLPVTSVPPTHTRTLAGLRLRLPMLSCVIRV